MDSDRSIEELLAQVAKPGHYKTPTGEHLSVVAIKLADGTLQSATFKGREGTWFRRCINDIWSEWFLGDDATLEGEKSAAKQRLSESKEKIRISALKEKQRAAAWKEKQWKLGTGVMDRAELADREREAKAPTRQQIREAKERQKFERDRAEIRKRLNLQEPEDL